MEKPQTIQFYYDQVMATADIFKLLKEFDVSSDIIYCTVKRLVETDSIADRKRSGRPLSVRTPAVIKKLA